jgi:sulfur carrier protein
MLAKGKVIASLRALFFLSLYGDIPIVSFLKRNTMEVTVNQQNYIVPDNCNVQTLLGDVLQQHLQGLAVAIDKIIIPKSQWGTQALKSGDNIIIIKATQGG